MQSMSADTVLGIADFMSNYIEPNFIKLKDKLFPPSQRTLDKRLTGFTSSYLFGFKGSLKVIRDALNKGANPNAVMDRINSEWEKIGSEPVLNKAVRFGATPLVEALVAAGADPAQQDSDGKTAIDLTQRRPALATYLNDKSAVAKLTSATACFNDNCDKTGPAPVVAPFKQPKAAGAKPAAKGQ